MSITPNFAVMLGDTLARWRQYRAEARTRRIVQSLPRNIRKDIGWLDTASLDRNHKHWI